MPGLFSGLFGGNQPRPTDARATSDRQFDYSQRAADITNNSQGFTANRGGLFGGTQATYDDQGNLTGQNQSSNLNTGALTGNFNDLASGLPGGFADYSSADPSSILSGGMANYDALSQPGIAQGQNRIDQEMANRGIPINDAIATDTQGNYDRQNALARGNVFQGLQQAMPGMQGQMINNINTMQNQPYQQLANTQGLMGGANALNPQFANFQTQGVTAPNYQGQVQANDQMNAANYQANQQALGGLLGGVAGLALTPLTGGIGNSLLGSAVGGLFNRGGGRGGADASGN